MKVQLRYGLMVLVAAALTGCSASYEQVDRTAAPPPVVVEHEHRQVIVQPPAPVYVTPPTVTKQSSSTYQSHGAVSNDLDSGTRSEHTYRHSESSTVQPAYPAPEHVPDDQD